MDITDTFTTGWHVESVEPSTIEITTDPAGVHAWLAVITRT